MVILAGPLIDIHDGVSETNTVDVIHVDGGIAARTGNGNHDELDEQARSSGFSLPKFKKMDAKSRTRSKTNSPAINIYIIKIKLGTFCFVD